MNHVISRNYRINSRYRTLYPLQFLDENRGRLSSSIADRSDALLPRFQRVHQRDHDAHTGHPE